MRLFAILLCLLPMAAMAQMPTSADHGPIQISEPRVCLHFPIGAIRRETNGTAKFSTVVGSDGTVRDASMTLSSGDTGLDEIALECVKGRTYQPAVKDGQPVEATLESMVTYSTENGRAGEIVWKTPHMLFTATMATGSITSAALACIRATPDIEAQAATAETVTGLRLSYLRGEVEHATVFSSSGNPNLDHVAQACFAGVPPNADRAAILVKMRFSIFAVPWKRLFPAASSPAK